MFYSSFTKIKHLLWNFKINIDIKHTCFILTAETASYFAIIHSNSKKMLHTFFTLGIKNFIFFPFEHDRVFILL